METYYFDEIDPAEELDVNTGDITSEETDEAIKCLRSRKAPGLDGIQAELLKGGGARQGCILSPFLFNICLDFVMRRAMRQTETGLSWYNEERLADLDFADDIALLAQDEAKLQDATTNLNSEATMIGLRISAEKSKVMSIGSNNAQMVINVDAKQLETVNKFTYLGSVIA
ncbi:hypothetical protein TELCIR_24222 [Teladorsagia circumcincta]|uniref:Reverse transcriptase domain-containing protein n=1 Tax=Teladorsagia circumcincta TaxID=45464 RepID=A0A2G9T8X1_TELCI|nr:hypothetical protein TELCIR_24222 [Teladorsagia circumcincta]